MLLAVGVLLLVAALLGVPATKECFDSRNGVCWDNGMHSSSLFVAGLLLPSLFWVAFPFWGILFDVGQPLMLVLFTLLALACIALVCVGTWNGRRRWGSAACVTYGTVLGVVMPWAIWAVPNLHDDMLFKHLYVIVVLTLSGLTVIAVATVRFRGGLGR